MRLVWCQSGNPRSAALAVEAGWFYGFRSDGNHYADRLGPVALLDCHWEADRLDWPRHLDVAALVRPWLATVPDTMAIGELDRTVNQAESLSPHCSQVLVIPKADGVIERLPREIGGKPVVLGYSVPTVYGGTPLPPECFLGWPVHLLGGTPVRQYALAAKQPFLWGRLNVISADGNVTWRLARRGIVTGTNGRGGKTLADLNGQRWPEKDAPLEALRRSLANLRVFWSRLDIEWRQP